MRAGELLDSRISRILGILRRIICQIWPTLCQKLNRCVNIIFELCGSQKSSEKYKICICWVFVVRINLLLYMLRIWKSILLLFLTIIPCSFSLAGLLPLRSSIFVNFFFEFSEYSEYSSRSCFQFVFSVFRQWKISV